MDFLRAEIEKKRKELEDANLLVSYDYWLIFFGYYTEFYRMTKNIFPYTPNLFILESQSKIFQKSWFII